MKRANWAAAAAFLAAACGQVESAAHVGQTGDLRFTEARVVSRETDNGATPMLLTTRAGDRVLAWVSAAGGGDQGRLHFSVTARGQSAPGPTITVEDPLGPIEPHGEAPPKLAEGDDGSIYVLYAIGKVVPGLRFPLSSLRLIRSGDRGETWSEPVTVNSGERFGTNNFHALTAGSGMVVVTWLESDRDFTGVAMSRSFDGGRTWEDSRTINADPSCQCCRTSVAIGHEGEMYVAWRTVQDGDVRDIVVARSDDGGDNWGREVRPRETNWVFPACPHAGPSLKVDDDGNLHIAWWTGKEGEAGVYYAWSADGGRSWTPRELSVGERSMPAHVQVVVSGGEVFVTWDDGLARVPTVVIRRSADGGRSFEPSQLLSDEGFAASFPVLAVVGDSLSVAWSQKGEQAFLDALASRPDMSDPNAVLGLPRVGQSEIFLRQAALR